MGGEMSSWESSQLWQLSSLAPMKEIPLIPGFENTSPEELRVLAYQAKGNAALMQAYVSLNTLLTSEQKENVQKNIVNVLLPNRHAGICESNTLLTSEQQKNVQKNMINVVLPNTLAGICESRF